MSRLAAERRGRRAELLAALLLMAKGYRILARRQRTRLGEIDLIARRGRALCFVEVKARSSAPAALAALEGRQRRRIEAAAQLLVGRFDPAGTLHLRFDLVLVRPWRLPRHLPDAWRPGQ